MANVKVCSTALIKNEILALN